MAIKYSVAEMKNPKYPDKPGKFYAKAQSTCEVDLDDLAEEICRRSALTDGTVISVVMNLTEVIRKHLRDGNIVNVNGLGKFQYQLSSEGADTWDEFDASHISKASIRFRPGNRIKDSVDGLSFEKVKGLKKK